MDEAASASWVQQLASVSVLCGVLAFGVLLLQNSQAAEEEMMTDRFHKLSQCGRAILDRDRAYSLVQGVRRLQCASLCGQNLSCLAYTIDGTDCFLYDTRLSSCNATASSPQAAYYIREHCFNGGKLININASCACPPFTLGRQCEVIMRDCHDWSSWTGRKDEVQLYIKPRDDAEEFLVHCQLEFGRTYIHRNSPSDDVTLFNVSWKEYLRGFHRDNNNFWIGLRQLHLLTGSGDRSATLEVSLEIYDNETFEYLGIQAYWRSFTIGDESSDFRLSPPIHTWDIGKNPIIQNCLRNSSGSKFTTFDHGDNASRAWASFFGGGWWFPSDLPYTDAICNPIGYHTPVNGSPLPGDIFFRGVERKILQTHFFIEKQEEEV